MILKKGRLLLTLGLLLSSLPFFAQDTTYAGAGIQVIFKEHGTGLGLAGKKFANCHFVIKNQQGLEIKNTYKQGSAQVISLVDDPWKQAWINTLRLLKVGDDVRINIPDSTVVKYWQAFLPTQPFKPFPLQIRFLALGAYDELPPDVVIVDDKQNKIPPPFNIIGKDTVKLKSGLRYIITHENPEGDQAYNGRTVEVHYTGYFEDGSVFDASYPTGHTFKFILANGHVIAGWDEGIRLMKTGDKFRFIIPPKLGYGDKKEGLIPPNTTLIFDVELISVD